MIRRQHEGSFLLITQDDHALLAADLAEHFGNDQFSPPSPFQQTIRGVRLHDSGWPLHDDQPTLNEKGLPLDVFESPRQVALKVWYASADRAAAADAYAGLLTSLHILSLSVFATESQTAHESFNLNDPRGRMDVLKFQHHELERQEELRSRLGLRTGKRGAQKLPTEGVQKAEDQLSFNFRLLQAMDLISLAACCTTPPTQQSGELLTAPGGSSLRLTLTRQDKDVLITPWPFKQPQIELQIPACRLPAQPFASDEAFQQAYKTASAEILICIVRPG